MTARHNGDEISFFMFGAALLRNRWRIVRWAFGGAVVIALLVMGMPRLYRATASFIPQSGDQARSSLANLAGQFGIALPGVLNQSVSPEFYVNLLTSPVLHQPIVRDTFIVPELGGQRTSFFDLFEIADGPPKYREELALEELAGLVEADVVAGSGGVIEVAVRTKWPSVSLAIVQRLVDGVNAYNQQTRQSQAAAERKFLEGRMAEANVDLRAAEEQLAQFMATNRQFGDASRLTFERDRLQRAVTMKQTLVTSLAQAYEDARLREVRDTPVITMFSQPNVPTLPVARGRVKRALLGGVIGGAIAVLLIMISEMVASRRREGLTDAEELALAFNEAKRDMLRPARWIGERVRR